VRKRAGGEEEGWPLGVEGKDGWKKRRNGTSRRRMKRKKKQE